jgi:fucose permease
LPISLIVFVSMCAAAPASLFMARFGRRFGFLAGALAGALGAAVLWSAMSARQRVAG